MARFAATIFLSAFLLFQVEPIIARFVVPWFGGSAAVWTTCLLFFQIVLLLGYLYAHAVIAKLSPRAQTVTHLTLLGISSLLVLTLHITPSAALRPIGGEDPTERILLLLALTVGLPYFTLSTTGPLLQAWFADRAARMNSGQVYPYRLYSLSNLGSMLALLSYPIVVEPLLTLRAQAWVWSLAYLVFAGFCAAIALGHGSDGATSSRPAKTAAPEDKGSLPTLTQYLAWLGLSATTSVLLLAVTNHVCQNVAAVPFLWVLPLSLYLLTFIICFGVREWRWPLSFSPLAVLAVAAMTSALWEGNENLGVEVLLPIWLIGLFVGCIVCHGELARLKPSPRHLTAYYLMMSLGGALGGLFVAWVAPRLFVSYFELHIAVGAVGVISLFVLFRDPEEKWFSPSWLAACALAVGLAVTLSREAKQEVSGCRLSVRNFYGVLQVRDAGEGDNADRRLNNGTILHGAEFLAPAKHLLPTTYYGPKSGVGRAIGLARRAGQGLRVGVIGLGTGTLAAYGQPGDSFFFYDINPSVVKIANMQFRYLPESKAQTQVILGDARLSLEKEESRQFDVLAVDAFSSDSIPVHLLTREAFATYFKQLKPDGVLCVHVSNRHVDLEPVVQAAADYFHRAAYLVTNDVDVDAGITASQWVLVSARPSLVTDLKGSADAPHSLRGFREWTDDYTNLFTLLK